MIRNTLAIVLGWIAGSAFNMALVTASNILYPLPEGVDPNDFEAFKTHVEQSGLATGALLLVLVAHAGGSFVSGLVCGLIAKREWYLAAVILGGFWTCGGLAMLFLLPSPLWFAITDILLYIPAALLGVHLGGGMASRRAPQFTSPP